MGVIEKRLIFRHADLFHWLTSWTGQYRDKHEYKGGGSYFMSALYINHVVCILLIRDFTQPSQLERNENYFECAIHVYSRWVMCNAHIKWSRVKGIIWCYPLDLPIIHWFNQWVNGSIDQSMNHTINQAIHQAINKSINQSINKSINNNYQWINQ